MLIATDYVRQRSERHLGCHDNMIKGAKSENVIEKRRLMGLSKRRKVQTVTFDLSGSMKYIALGVFPTTYQMSVIME